MSDSMQAMILTQAGAPLMLRTVRKPVPGPGEVRIAVSVCGVCRTDLHIVDGELAHPKASLIPGHEIVGTVESCGAGVSAPAPGDRVGVPWLGWTCGACAFCLGGHENLCDRPAFTGYTRDGGYAEFVVCDARYCLPIPERYDDAHAAPLLCAGLIGYRALRLAGDTHKVGIYGFGAAAHIVAQVLKHQGRPFYAFTRPGDTESQHFARQLGASWVGDASQMPPEHLDAALIFAPAGPLVPAALSHLEKGGCVVCAGIHMSDIPAFPYADLWGERSIRSVANLTRQDGLDFLALAPKVPVHTSVTAFRLEEANEALERLRRGELQGAAVLGMG